MALSDIADVNRGVRVVKKQLADVGYPVFQNALSPMGFHSEYNREGNETYVISAGAAGEIGYCREQFWAADDCLVFDNLRGVINKFLYYSLLNRSDYILRNVRKASIPRLSREIVENTLILLPDEQKQKEIIDMLDKLDALCLDISGGLPAEINARQKQYEYYREVLMTFEEKVQ